MIKSNMKEMNKEKLIHLPTPLEYLPALSEMLGVEFYIKRDDLTNLAGGGNKLRKLEYILHDAVLKGATALVTVGGAQTNHGRLTAAVAAKYGMKCSIVAIDEYPGEISANILLDRIMGAELILHKDDGTPIMDLVERVLDKYRKEGEIPYFIPMGGSNELGALGYYECAKELLKQTDGGRVFVAVGSMGTYMGLFCGLLGTCMDLTGILIGPFYDDVLSYAMDYFDRVNRSFDLGLSAKSKEFDIRTEFIRGGYNNPVKEVRDAIYEMARKEAVILDPCYTGKAYAAIKDMVESGEISQGEKIIFLHTGGGPGLNTPSHRREMEKELMSGLVID